MMRQSSEPCYRFEWWIGPTSFPDVAIICAAIRGV
jgi:hypothetical protein